VSTLEQQANLLGAFAGVIADMTTAEMTTVSGLAASDGSALSALKARASSALISRNTTTPAATRASTRGRRIAAQG